MSKSSEKNGRNKWKWKCTVLDKKIATIRIFVPKTCHKVPTFRINQDSDAVERKREKTAFLSQCLILIRRSSLHLFHDVTNYWLSLAIFALAALSLGTMLLDIGSINDTIQVIRRK